MVKLRPAHSYNVTSYESTSALLYLCTNAKLCIERTIRACHHHDLCMVSAGTLWEHCKGLCLLSSCLCLHVPPYIQHMQFVGFSL